MLLGEFDKQQLLTEQVNIISKQNAIDRKLFGPVYHGTTHEFRKKIEQQGFTISNPFTSRNGYDDEEYALGLPAPIHHLGFGIYFTTSKSIAKQFNENSLKGLNEYYLDVPRLEVINFVSPNKMMNWWINNGYDTHAAEKGYRIQATYSLTNYLKSKYDAVWFKGKGLYRLLDGDQIVVFNPENIYKIDSSLAKPGEIGSKVIRKSDGMKGILINTRTIPDQFRNYHNNNTRFLEIKWKKGGKTYNNYDSDVIFPPTMISEADKISPESYRRGIERGIAHGADTARKFVPHVAGSAIGAFVGGLRGQSLESNVGRVRITKLENELENIGNNPRKIDNFFDSEIKKHFIQYDRNSQQNIKKYMSRMYDYGKSGKTYNENNIKAELHKITNDPFKNITKENEDKLIKYFMEFYVAGKNIIETEKIEKKIDEKSEMPNVISALENLGYKKKNAVSAVAQAVSKNDKLKNNFDQLLKASQAVIQK